MKPSKVFNNYTEEINKLAEGHAEALLALYVEAFSDGLRIGKRDVLIGLSVAAVAGVIGLCLAEITYLEHKEQL